MEHAGLPCDPAFFLLIRLILVDPPDPEQKRKLARSGDLAIHGRHETRRSSFRPAHAPPFSRVRRAGRRRRLARRVAIAPFSAAF
jgi:hypothetical protein